MPMPKNAKKIIHIGPKDDIDAIPTPVANTKKYLTMHSLRF